MDREAWRAAVHGVAKSRAGLSDWTELNWHCTILYYSILYSAILFYTLLYSSILCYTLLYFSILCYTLLYSAILCYILLYYAILFYTLLYSAIIIYTMLYYACFPGSSAIKNPPAMQETQVDPWVEKILWRRKWQPTPVLLAGKFHRWRSLAGSMELQRVGQLSVCTHTHTHTRIYVADSLCCTAETDTAHTHMHTHMHVWLTHFAVQQKLTQQCETPIGQ